jgi:hypothetical protein
VRRASGEQLIEQNAERVDVGGGGDPLPPHLLRTRGRGRHHPLGGDGIGQRPIEAGVQELGDPEIEQLGHPVGGDQNIPGLDVPMHDEVPMRVTHGLTDRPKQDQPVAEAEARLVGVPIDGPPLDILHDEIRNAARAGPSIEQARDVGMIERREDLSLRLEAANHVADERAGLHQLDGDASGIRGVGALGEPHRSHAASPDFPNQPVGPEGQPGVAGDTGHIHGGVAHGALDECAIPGHSLVTKQPIDFPGQLGIVGAFVSKQRDPIVRFEADGPVEQCGDFRQALSGHGSLRPELIVDPVLGEAQIAMDRDRRDLQHPGDLVILETAEIV